MRPTGKHILCCVLLLTCLLTVTAVDLQAGTNTVRAGIGGLDNGTLDGGDGTGTGRVTINTVDLALIKQARDLSGGVLPDGAAVSSGQELYFVLYVDNPTAVAAVDIRIIDSLNEAEFTYIPDSLQTTTVASGSGSAAIWAGPWTVCSDSLGPPDDVASITDSSAPAGLDRITAGRAAGQINQVVNIPDHSLWAIRFRVRVN